VWWASIPPSPFYFSRAASSAAARRPPAVRPHGRHASVATRITYVSSCLSSSSL
jgi:hypothetical protein